MDTLRYLHGYPDHLQQQVRDALAAGRLGRWLAARYPERHQATSDRALYAYAMGLKQSHLRHAPGIDKVCYDAKLDVVKNALGLHTAISRVHGGRLKAKKEIRIASVFRDAPAAFLETIVVHELAHLKETEHNKAFYQLCEYMQPEYHQREFDLRVYLTWRDLAPPADAADQQRE
ncbi:MAG: M48 family metallopeptidase [Xanthomonadaceae bacterium]|nr:M48 family metallopeptidase [Xanthomonadaceae bacterium]MDE1962946.1 M48 family metallopeptidase [Xanthomonadaceae bacterium]